MRIKLIMLIRLVKWIYKLDVLHCFGEQMYVCLLQNKSSKINLQLSVWQCVTFAIGLSIYADPNEMPYYVMF